MIPGESPAESCSRVVKTDLGLNVVPERFIFIEVSSNVFAKRREPPPENGCHDVNLIHLVVLEDAEIAMPVIGRWEYETAHWFHPVEISSKLGVFHPATISATEKALEILYKRK